MDSVNQIFCLAPDVKMVKVLQMISKLGELVQNGRCTMHTRAQIKAVTGFPDFLARTGRQITDLLQNSSDGALLLKVIEHHYILPIFTCF